MKCIVSGIFGIAAIGGMSLSLSGSEVSDIPSAWRLMAGFSANEALTIVARQPDSAERQLAFATALLGKYPQTPANVDQAETLLKHIVKEKAITDVQAAAWYLLGRIQHIFHEDREAEAVQYYRQLLKFYPNDQLADSAAVKVALIAVGRITETHSEGEVRQTIEDLTLPRGRLAQSDFHSVLAEFYLERGDLPAALDRLLKVRALGANQGKNEADLMVQIGRVAGELGRKDISIGAFETFLVRFPSDARGYMVRDRLKRLRDGGIP
jgi:tetratricopeptide (TPR) repeat protein